MKALLLATVLLVAMFVITGCQTDERQEQKAINSLCESLYDFAIGAHKLRYLGLPLSDALQSSPLPNSLRIEQKDTNFSITSRQITKEAYSRPLFQSETEEINDRLKFALDKQNECLDGYWREMIPTS